MEIKTFIINRELPQLEERIQKLEDMNAPAVIIENAKSEAAKMSQGEIKISGRKDKLGMEVTSAEMKGKGKNLYWSFNNGEAIYYPNSKYGRHIK